MYRIVDIQFQYWYCHFKHCDFDCLVFETFESFHKHISVSDNFLWYFFSLLLPRQKNEFFLPYLRSFEVSHKLLRAIEERQAKYLNKTLKVFLSLSIHIFTSQRYQITNSSCLIIIFRWWDFFFSLNAFSSFFSFQPHLTFCVYCTNPYTYCCYFIFLFFLCFFIFIISLRAHTIDSFFHAFYILLMLLKYWLKFWKINENSFWRFSFSLTYGLYFLLLFCSEVINGCETRDRK